MVDLRYLSIFSYLILCISFGKRINSGFFLANKNKFFSKKTIDPKDANITGITAVNILDQHLITGDEKGNIAIC